MMGRCTPEAGRAPERIPSPLAETSHVPVMAPRSPSHELFFLLITTTRTISIPYFAHNTSTAEPLCRIHTMDRDRWPRQRGSRPHDSLHQ
jgi:hypothetical protein